MNVARARATQRRALDGETASSEATSETCVPEHERCAVPLR
jgi:hypothetical protein